jgi:glycosyltransferase involved in cell wall biosynthesis
MTSILIAVACAVLAACCFAGAMVLQHSAVRATTTGEFLGVRALGRTIRSRRWLAGAGLAVAGSGLHVTALALAPLVIVQPVGVLSLVLTVLLGARIRRVAVAPRVRVAVTAVCAGVVGFVLVAATGATGSAAPGSVRPFVAGAVAVASAGLFSRGWARCVVMAAAAAMLFGTGSALIRAASLAVLGGGVPTGLGLAAESVLLILAGGWLLHQGYAAGPAAVVIAVTTVVDPLTAIVVGIAAYHESAGIGPGQAAAQFGSAAVAIAAVIILARAIPDPPHDLKEPPMPTAGQSTGSALRILIAADTFPPDVNGAAQFADRLARGLAHRGHDVHVVCPAHAAGAAGSDDDGGLTVHRIPSLGTPFHPTFRIATPWAASRVVEPLLARLRPDVVHVQSHFGVGRTTLRAATARGAAVIATNHFMPENLLGYAPIPPFLQTAVTRWAWRDLVRVYRRAQVVTAPTPRAVRLLNANGLPGSPLAISCGIDLDHYRTGGRDVDGTALSVLFVGRLDKEKNVDELIRAAATLPDVRLEIVGDGACRERLTALAERLGVLARIRFHGFVSDRDLVTAYQHADVFCMPGTAELQSLATMEAMAAGLPVIAADAMALPHLVHPGVNGLLYPPGNVTLLAAALAEFANNPAGRAAMGQASRTIITRHDIQHTLDTFESLYRTTAGTTARPTLVA